MGKCQTCEKDINDNYKYCIDCNRKRTETNVQGDLLKELRLINNNLAHIRAAVCKDESLKKSLSQPPKQRSAQKPVAGKN